MEGLSEPLETSPRGSHSNNCKGEKYSKYSTKFRDD